MGKFADQPDLFSACYQGEKLIGVCWGFLFRKEIRLIRIAVDANYWKKGIGKKLLKFWESQVKKTGGKKISLGAAKHPMNVIEFYEKSGYSSVKEKEKYVVMEKEL